MVVYFSSQALIAQLFHGYIDHLIRSLPLNWISLQGFSKEKLNIKVHIQNSALWFAHFDGSIFL